MLIYSTVIVVQSERLWFHRLSHLPHISSPPLLHPPLLEEEVTCCRPAPCHLADFLSSLPQEREQLCGVLEQPPRCGPSHTWTEEKLQQWWGTFQQPSEKEKRFFCWKRWLHVSPLALFGLLIRKSETDPHVSDEESRAVSFLVTQEWVKSTYVTD